MRSEESRVGSAVSIRGVLMWGTRAIFIRHLRKLVSL